MSDSDKYAQIQSIGEEKENIKDINQTNKDIWSDGWRLGFLFHYWLLFFRLFSQ